MNTFYVSHFFFLYLEFYFNFFMLSFMETEAFKVLKGLKNNKMVHVTCVLYSRSSECI